MKKFFIVVFLIFCTMLSVSAKKASKDSVVRVEIETKDRYVLVGDLYFSKAKDAKKPLVVMLHSVGGKSADWGELPKRIKNGGYNVFALDLRGHGRSVYKTNLTYRSRNYFKKDDWQKFPDDIVTSIKFLESNYSKIDYNHIIFVGADLGANTAILAGEKLKHKPDKMVLITPAKTFKTLDIPLVIANYDKTPMMILVSAADKYFYAQANLLSKFIQTECIMRIFQNGGAGTTLIKQNPTGADDIIKFIYGLEIK